jgi:hypothetical protein
MDVAVWTWGQMDVKKKYIYIYIFGVHLSLFDILESKFQNEIISHSLYSKMLFYSKL